MGVTLFFVLSGYLITGILIREWNKTEKIDLPRFWIHRVRRLFPAIVFMVCTVLVITAFLRPDLLTKLRNDLFAALFWFTNWWYIFQDVSYFEAMGAPSPVTHFWSLAIEEQFYLVWPPLLLLLFKNKVKKRTVEIVVLVLAVISVVLMAVLYVPGGDPSRVYYGTDTRAFSLLIGALLAFAFPAHRVRGRGRHGFSPKQRKSLGVAGMACFVGIVVMMVFVDGFSPFMYYGGILIASLLTGVLVLALVDPVNPIAKAFSVRPIVYIGKISYGIYIWHYPILLLMTDFNSTVAAPWWWHVLQILVIFGVSAFSYKFVEEPIRKGRLGDMWHAVKDKRTTWSEVLRKHAVQLACAVALVLGATIACIVTPYTTTQSDVSYTDATVVPEGALDGEAAVEEDPAALEARREEYLGQLGNNPALPSLSVQTLQALAETEGANAVEKAHNTKFLLIGDSVTASFTSPYYGDFSGMFPNAILDSAQNRTISLGLQVMDYYNEKNWDGPVFIFELGTNVRTTPEEMETLLAEVPEGKMVFLVNVRANVPQMEETNLFIAQLAETHPNVEVIDWCTESTGHDDFFAGDGTHLSPDVGAPAFQQMLLRYLETLYLTDLGADSSANPGVDPTADSTTVPITETVQEQEGVAE